MRWCRSLVAMAGALSLGCPAPIMQPRDDTLPDVPDLDAEEGCGPYTPETLMKCVSEKRLEADVIRIAHPRAPDSADHEAVRQLCKERFEAMGLEVRLHRYESGVNVIGERAGFSEPHKRVLIGAHYDSVDGQCAAADDNASGVAVMLEIARVLSMARFDHTLMAVCWDEGEREQLGSAAQAHQMRANKDELSLVVSFEAIAYATSAPDSQRIPEGFEQLFPDQALALLESDYRADFLTIVAESSTESWAKRMLSHADDLDLTVHVLTLTDHQKHKQKKLHRSDHASFWEQGYPALLVTDSGPFRNDRIHCKSGPDDPASLDYRFAQRAARASLGAIAEALVMREQR